MDKFDLVKKIRQGDLVQFLIPGTANTRWTMTDSEAIQFAGGLSGEAVIHTREAVGLIIILSINR